MRPSFQKPLLMDDGVTRSLHFDYTHAQSEMRLDAPTELVFGYTQAMMAFLLVHPAPRDVLLVGLGGGSLSKYCHALLPDSMITTVEINPAVIALRESFHIPPDSHSFQIVEQDAAVYMRYQRGVANVILLDGYDEAGLPPALTTLSFYQDCHRALRDDGVLVANFNCHELQLASCRRLLSLVFGGRILLIRPTCRSNTVLLAVKVSPDVPDGEWHARGEYWSQRTGLPMKDFCEQLLIGLRRRRWGQG